MTQAADRSADASPWSPREAELLAVTLQAAITDDLWDVLPGYLIFRSIVPDRPPIVRTVQALVDDFIVPGLTRCAR